LGWLQYGQCQIVDENFKEHETQSQGLKIEKKNEKLDKFTGELSAFGQLKESPDHSYYAEEDRRLHWDDEDAMSIVIFMDTAIIRGNGDSHADMIYKLGDFSKDIYDDKIPDKNIVYGKKMELLVDGVKRTFVFSRVVDRQFFREFHNYYRTMKFKATNVARDLDSGRIWLNSKIISFWKGNNEKNFQLTADALNLNVSDLVPESRFNVNTKQAELAINESPDYVSGVDGKELGYMNNDARPFVIFNGICAIRDHCSMHREMFAIMSFHGQKLAEYGVDHTKFSFGQKMSLPNSLGENKTFYFSSVPDANWFIDFYRESKDNDIRSYDSGRVWLESNIGSFWKGCNRPNVKLLLKALLAMNHKVRSGDFKIEVQDKNTLSYTGKYTSANELK